MTGTFLVCGSALYSRPCRREPGLQLQETEIKIWRLLKGFLQHGANRRGQTHQTASSYPTLPGCAFPQPPQSTEMHLGRLQRARGHFLSTEQTPAILHSSERHPAGSAAFTGVSGWEVLLRLVPHQPEPCPEGSLVKLLCREGKSQVWVCLSRLEKQPW